MQVNGPALCLARGGHWVVVVLFLLEGGTVRKGSFLLFSGFSPPYSRRQYLLLSLGWGA